MSERGTFITSFLYDPTVVEALRKVLPTYARKWAYHEFTCPESDDPQRVWYISGIMHGGWSGEESMIQADGMIDELVQVLPDDHGMFSIVVMPEDATRTRVMTFYKGKVTRDEWLDNPETAESKAFNAACDARDAAPRQNISDIARGLTPPTE